MFLQISEQIPIIFLYIINWQSFQTEAAGVLCEIRTESSFQRIMWTKFIYLPWLSRLVGGLSPRWPEFDLGTVIVSSMAEKWCWGRLFPSVSVFPCQYYYTNVPHLSSSTCYSDQDKSAMHGNLQKTILFGGGGFDVNVLRVLKIQISLQLHSSIPKHTHTHTHTHELYYRWSTNNF